MKPTNFDTFQSQLALPFLETDQDLLRDIFNILKQNFCLLKNSNQRFIDLGSGDGRVVIYSALNYGIKSLGIEINLTLILEAKERIKALKKSKSFKKSLFKLITIKEGDLFKQDLADFDFIYIYALPSIHKFLNHVFITAKDGAIIISHKYPFNDFKSYLKTVYTLDINTKENNEKSTYFYSKF